MRSERRRDLLRILREGRSASQRAIVEELRAVGHAVTQATVSRDLREMGATKIRMGGRVVYRLPDELPKSQTGDLVARSLARTLREFAIDIQPAGSLVVLLTAPGHAAAVARAIDLADLTEVVGTVAGDDTIFVATPDADTALRMRDRWQVAIEGDRSTMLETWG
ncbi:MAG: arginine repressor [Actinomycetota bacterium]